MPFSKLEPKLGGIASRVLIVGAPNTQKSTSLLTWPGPGDIISMPGEKGHETLRGNTKHEVYVWNIDNPETVSPVQIVRELEQCTFQCLANDKLFLGIDGLHKCFGWYYRRARLEVESWSSTGKMEEDKKNLIAYNPAYDAFQLFMTRLLQSTKTYVAVTVWEGDTKDDPTDIRSRSHLFPDLPGKMAKWIVGEFSAVLFSEVSQPDPRGHIKGTWVSKPLGKIWGVGVKMQPDKAILLPPRLDNNFPALAKAVGEEL